MEIQINLEESDYTRLISDDDIDVFSELVKLNMTRHYHNTLDVIRLTRDINLERIKRLMKG